MNKVGVCACYDTKNYGSMLQCLATGKTIENLGFDYEIIRYSRKKTLGLAIRSIGRIPERIKLKIKNIKRKRLLKKYPEVLNGISIRNNYFELFMSNNFTRLSPICDTFNDLTKLAITYDAVLVGSDQLWRPEGYSTGFYNLLFVPDKVKKISYATSFGISQIPKGKEKIAKRFLNRIEYISLRELRGSEMVRELIGRDAPTVLDPTLLFTGDEWKELLEDKSIIDEEYIFCYLLGNNPDQRDVVRKLSDETKLQIVTIPHLDEFVKCDLGFGDKQLYNIGPSEFVNLIRHATFICTDSFHGSVFSILNHKKFVTFNRFSQESKNSRNSRIDSLLKQTGLEERKYFSGDKRYIKEVIETEIKFEEVDTKLEKLREKSLEYLSNALNA